MSSGQKLKSWELTSLNRKDLLKKLEEPKAELSNLRVAQVTGGAASKVGKIKQVRKNIARILTVINTKARDAYKKEVKGYKNNKVPKTLRQKKTRAIRRALTPKELGAETLKQKKKRNFALKKYAVKA